MKILHVLGSNQFSGAENVVCQIIDMFRGDSNIEMAYTSPDGVIKEALEEREIKFLPMNKLTVKNLKSVIKEYNPDVIHAHDMKASFIAARAAEKKCLISHIHNNALNSRRLSIKSLAYIFAGKRASHILWVSKSSFDGYKFHSRFEEKSTVLYNVLDVEKLKNKKEQDFNIYPYDIVYVGRLTYQKNPQRLIRVLKEAIKRLPDLKIAIVGTGELEDEIKQMCCLENLNNNISFLGYCNNPLKIVSDAKLMLMTSRWEGTPMCALEAMALGTPIVGTPTDGLKDLIENNENGFLSDQDEELIDEICRLCLDSAALQQMRQGQLEKSLMVNDIENYKTTLRDIYYESGNSKS